MKGAFIALFIGITLLVLLYLQMDVSKDKATIDIHVHDTYYVMSYTSVIVFVLLFLGTFFSIGGTIGSYFKSKLFWALAVLLLSIDTYYVVSFYKLFSDSEATSVLKESNL